MVETGWMEMAALSLLVLVSVLGPYAACQRRLLAAANRRSDRLEKMARRRGRKLAENLRLRRMVEEVADIGLWHYFPADSHQEWSGGLKALFGFDHDEPMHDGDAETLLAANGVDLVGDVMKPGRGKGAFRLRFGITRLDGQQRELKMRACHIRDESGQVQSVIGVAIDVSELAEREKRLRQSRQSALRAARRARELAETDPLTGLANRRRVMSELGRLVIHQRDAGNPLSLIIFDIDHFKRVNDTFGHPAGDEVLRQISFIAEEQVREGDILGRIGGEEFIWVVPGADAGFARLAAERLRLAISVGSSVGDVPAATVSLGIATAQHDDTALSLFARADAALYEAKGAGRNTVRLAA